MSKDEGTEQLMCRYAPYRLIYQLSLQITLETDSHPNCWYKWLKERHTHQLHIQKTLKERHTQTTAHTNNASGNSQCWHPHKMLPSVKDCVHCCPSVAHLTLVWPETPRPACVHAGRPSRGRSTLPCPRLSDWHLGRSDMETDWCQIRSIIRYYWQEARETNTHAHTHKTNRWNTFRDLKHCFQLWTWTKQSQIIVCMIDCLAYFAASTELKLQWSTNMKLLSNKDV